MVALSYTPYMELNVDPALAREGAKGVYGLDAAAAGTDDRARLQGQLQGFRSWYTSVTNPERSSDPLSAATMDGHLRAIVYYLGYAVRFCKCAGTFESLMDGARLQQYAAFLMARPCTPGTVVKVLGQVRAPHPVD